jgi:hypothetical protein
MMNVDHLSLEEKIWQQAKYKSTQVVSEVLSLLITVNLSSKQSEFILAPLGPAN